MIGERIRQARLLAGLTLDEVAAQMTAHNQRITKAGLSKYENNKSTPKPDFLVLLAHLLGVRSSYFWEQTTVRIDWIAFRKHAQLPVKEQDQIKATALKYAESFMWLQHTLNKTEKASFPKSQKVKDLSDVESIADSLRKNWKLNFAPIDNMIQTIEDRGGVVMTYPAIAGRFDGLAGWVNEKFPIIVSNSSISNDRFRYNLAHEMGHLVMELSSKDSKDAEKFAHRFAASFLVPAKVAFEELGPSRRTLSIGELRLLKRKYGMSMQAWARRARDLDIIDENQYKRQCITFNAYGMKKIEPDDHPVREEPQKLKLMTLRAHAEGMITKDKAEELCPGCVKELESAPVPATGKKIKSLRTAIDIMRLPKQERDKIMLTAAKKAEKVYRENKSLTSFEAFAEDDLHDETK